jgi:hypothetical protein
MAGFGIPINNTDTQPDVIPNFTIVETVTFFTEEDGLTHPDKLIIEVTLNEGLNGIYVYGDNNRGYRLTGEVGTTEIAFNRLGYSNLTQTSDLTYYIAPIVNGVQTRRQARQVSLPDNLPDEMTAGYTFGTWDGAAGTLNITVATPPTSPTTITSYVVNSPDANFWSVEAEADGSELTDTDFAFDPDNYPEWQWGVTDWDVDLTISAKTAEGLGPPSSPADTINIDQEGIYYVADADWNMTSIDDAGPAGLVDVEFEGASTFDPTSPWTTRVYIGPLPSDVDEATLLPLDWATFNNTLPIIVGSTVRVSTGLVADDDAYAVILMYNATSGEFQLGSTRKTTPVLAVDLPGNPPTVDTGPSVNGLLNSIATIGVQLTGSTTWVLSTTFTNRFQVSNIDVGTLATDTHVLYTPVAGDDGKTLRLHSVGTNANGSTDVFSQNYSVRYAAPTAVGSLPTKTYEYTVGAGSVAGATVVAAFAGSNRTYSIQSSIATINSSTGLITIPVQTGAFNETITVTASNSGGSATQSFQLLITAPDLFVWPTDPAQNFMVVREVTDPDEATTAGFPGVAGKFHRTVTAIDFSPTTEDGEFSLRGAIWGEAYSTALPELTAGTFYSSGTAFTNGYQVGSQVTPKAYWRHLPTGDTKLAWTHTPITIAGLEVDPPEATELPAIPTAQFTTATGLAATRYSNSLGGGCNNAWPGPASVYEAYESFRGNTAADSHVLAQIRYSIQGANCPVATNGFCTQMELWFAIACTITKNNPRVWNGTGLGAGLTPLNATEKLKVELLIKALLVAAAHCTSTKNNQIVANTTTQIDSINGEDYWWKSAPNYSCAGPSMVKVCAVFLGNANATSFLNTFNRANFATQLSDQGLTNAFNTWTGSGGSGKPTTAQIAASVVNWVCASPNFTSLTINSPLVDFVSAAATRVFNALVETGYGGDASNGWIGPGHLGYAKITTGEAGLPNKGIRGMLTEFAASDANGPRSALTPYGMYGSRIPLTMMLLGICLDSLDPGTVLPLSNATFIAAFKQMNVGMTDLEYKSINGYRNFEKGSGDIYTETGTGSNGGLSYYNRIGAGTPRVRGVSLGIYHDVIKIWYTENGGSL